MLMEQVADFVNFLGQRNHSKEEVLVHLALRTFSPLQCNGVVLAELKPSGVMEITAKYGVDDDFFDAHPKRFRLTEQMPITDSIKTRETIWITTLPSWGEDYEQLQQLDINRTMRNNLMDWFLEFLQLQTQHLTPLRSLEVLRTILH